MIHIDTVLIFKLEDNLNMHLKGYLLRSDDACECESRHLIVIEKQQFIVPKPRVPYRMQINCQSGSVGPSSGRQYPRLSMQTNGEPLKFTHMLAIWSILGAKGITPLRQPLKESFLINKYEALEGIPIMDIDNIENVWRTSLPLSKGPAAIQPRLQPHGNVWLRLSLLSRLPKIQVLVFRVWHMQVFCGAFHAKVFDHSEYVCPFRGCQQFQDISHMLFGLS
eukprot:TRINITY_DN2711_c0_g2_i3.p1 TRINITY_DN2711_c0_g2~~TRINITY_DN2711_c0_g2_i3.p1  ORF type:complete len:222 (+),score=-2.89 TRINITY_DN2711_c0_g2_i3:41-706(+)